MSNKENCVFRFGRWALTISFAVFLVWLFKSLLTQSILLYSESPDGSYGQVGDLFNGMVSPIIGLLSAGLVFIAFREQVKANKELADLQDRSIKLQEESNKIQKRSNKNESLKFNGEILSRFSEMLKSAQSTRHHDIRYYLERRVGDLKNSIIEFRSREDGVSDNEFSLIESKIKSFEKHIQRHVDANRWDFTLSSVLRLMNDLQLANFEAERIQTHLQIEFQSLRSLLADLLASVSELTKDCQKEIEKALLRSYYRGIMTSLETYIQTLEDYLDKKSVISKEDAALFKNHLALIQSQLNETIYKP